MVLNFDKNLGAVLNRAKTDIVTALGQPLMAAMASDYRNGMVLSGVTWPAMTTTPEIDLDSVVVTVSGETMFNEALRSVRKTPATVAYLRPFEDDLLSPVKGRRLVAACALLCFLLRD